MSVLNVTPNLGSIYAAQAAKAAFAKRATK